MIPLPSSRPYLKFEMDERHPDLQSFPRLKRVGMEARLIAMRRTVLRGTNNVVLHDADDKAI